MSQPQAAQCPQERWAALAQLDDWLRTPMLFLSFLWLLVVLIELVQGTTTFLTWIATAVWIVFIVEFALRFMLAPEKTIFLRRNVITVVALAVPAFRMLRAFAVLRAARVLRGFQLVRIIGTANRSMNALRKTLRRRQFGYVLGLTGLVIALGAAGMLTFEPEGQVEGGFATYWDALWWTMMMVTTVGSGFWPETSEGRALTSLLTLYGLAMFGYVTATFATFFIGRDAEDDEGELAGSSELRMLREDIAALRSELARR